MVRKYIYCLVAILLSVASAAQGALPKGFYPSTSRLSAGKWVKVETDTTGIFEISYDELRKMGFENPGKVGVFGLGGQMMCEDFSDINNNPLIDGDIEPIAVLHQNDRILFYGQGMETITIEANDMKNFGSPYHFERPHRNHYVRKGNYLLSDTSCLEMELGEYNPDYAEVLQYGLDYWYHEQDLSYNPTRTGRVLLGEDLAPMVQPVRVFPYDLPLAVLNQKVRLESEIYRDPGYTGQVYHILEGVPGTACSFTTDNQVYTRAIYMSETRSLAKNKGTLTLQNSSTIQSTATFNLDYFMMTYRKSILEELPVSFERYLFAELQGHGKLSLPIEHDWLVLDITSPRKPKLLEKFNCADNKHCYYSVQQPTGPAHVLVANPNGEFFKVGKWEELANNDLHSRASKGAELLIITTPEFHAQAEEIADLHRVYDGLQVLVADVDEIYNEFSSSNPDAMAYRSLAKMLFLNAEHQLQNVLLFGPIIADSYGIFKERDYKDFIIAWQDSHSDLSIPFGVANDNMWIGMMDDRSIYEPLKRTVQVGVGVLPVANKDQAELMVSKIERHLTDDSFPYRTNRYAALGGIGDAQLHAQYTLASAERYNKLLEGASITHPVITDSYENEQKAIDRVIDVMGNPPLMTTFFGHGSVLGFGTMFYASDIPRLRNSNLGFASFFGCTLSKNDCGEHGVGAQLILNTPHGLVGGLVPTRSSTAYANSSFNRVIQESLFYINPLSSVQLRRRNALTIGQTIALARSCAYESVEGAYQLMCDPALVIPFPSYGIRAESETVEAGSRFDLAGEIITDSTLASDFNGEVVVRVMEPEYVVQTLNKVSKESDKTSVPFGDVTAAMYSSEVKDGKFSIPVKVPLNAVDVENNSTRIVLCAYDATRRVAAAGNVVVSVNINNDNQETDNEIPVIEKFEFNPNTKELHLIATDNDLLPVSESLLVSCLTLKIDGKDWKGASNATLRVKDAGRMLETSFALPELSDGAHSAELILKDASGNSARSSISFTIGQLDDFILNLSSSTLTYNGEIDVTTEYDVKEVVICDAQGKIANRLAVANGKTCWVGDNEYKQRLPRGIYTVTAVKDNGSHSRPRRVTIL